MRELFYKGLSGLREQGVRVTLGRAADSLKGRFSRRAVRADCERYAQWVRRFDTMSPAGRRDIERRLLALEHHPLISVLMPVYDVPEVWLRRAIESVRAQIYPRWELCVADDASTQGHVRAVLGRYAAADPRIKVIFREQNGHISAASNSALSLAAGEFAALLDHDDELHETALYHVAAELNAHPGAALLYSDEDMIDAGGTRLSAHFKPDWNPDLFLSQNFINHLSVYRTQTLREAGGFREGYEGSQDYDLALRVIERVPASDIRHIPRVLYHWRAVPGSTSIGAGEKSYAAGAALRALASHLGRVGREGEVLTEGNYQYQIKYRLPARPPKVQVIVAPPAAADRTLNEFLVELASNTSYRDYEVTVVRPSSNGGPAPPPRPADPSHAPVQVRTINCGDADDGARALNAAARAADGEVLLFLDVMLSPIDRDWMGEMVSHALRPEIGAVGAKLLDGGGKILHGGLLLGVGARGSAQVAGSPFYGMAEGHLRATYFGRSRLVQNFSAVAKSCFMIRRALFEELGGFDELNLPRVFYDVDLCLRLGRRGHRALYTPFAKLRLRSRPSGACAYPPGYGASARAEVEHMRGQWGMLLRNDPHYNPNLELARGDYDLAFPPRLNEPR